MLNSHVDNSSIISAQLSAFILGSPRLKTKLFPQGLFVLPYTVLDYDATLVLEDKHGSVATFRRTQRVQFQQDGVRAILDHFWGDGVVLTNYRHSAGRIADSFKSHGRRHLVIGLKQPAGRGQ